jgi:hypothetical protein
VTDMTYAHPSTASYLANEARRAELQACARSAYQPMPTLGWQTSHYSAVISRQAELRAQAAAFRLAARAGAGTGGPTRLRRWAGTLLIRAGSVLAGALTTTPQTNRASGRLRHI